MKSFKIADCFIQCLLLAIGVGYYLSDVLHRDFISNNYFFIPYIFTGGWQLLSVSVHALNPQYNKKILRRIYLVLLLMCITAAVVTYFFGDALLWFFFILLFFSPAMAIYYCIVCFIETKAIKDRAGIIK